MISSYPIDQPGLQNDGSTVEPCEASPLERKLYEALAAMQAAYGIMKITAGPDAKVTIGDARVILNAEARAYAALTSARNIRKYLPHKIND